jgi:SAM-dependent methyltransferase
MTACCPADVRDTIGAHFDARIARRDLGHDRKAGPGVTTRLLRDLLVEAPADGVLLDVGCGIGGLTFELLGRGIDRAVAVDASATHIAAASSEATRRGVPDAVPLIAGDFLDLAAQLPSATVVALDRIDCASIRKKGRARCASPLVRPRTPCERCRCDYGRPENKSPCRSTVRAGST